MSTQAQSRVEPVVDFSEAETSERRPNSIVHEYFAQRESSYIRLAAEREKVKSLLQFQAKKTK